MLLPGILKAGPGNGHAVLAGAEFEDTVETVGQRARLAVDARADIGDRDRSARNHSAGGVGNPSLNRTAELSLRRSRKQKA